ncbi:MAG: hypothetical protein FJ216_06095 [Ignavibacteria bacterium]|nr:hypothetical protein [Ignavibacteria bacterium]
MYNIIAEIKGIKYKSFFNIELEEINFEKFNINICSAFCSIYTQKGKFAISKWVSPKRTRSYPFERVYNTLGFSKKITVIPIIKDEGEKGDRDFIQWDTISLMSLLDVYVILAYYNSADINPRLKGKITNQKFNNKFVKSKIEEISNYHSSALHWNLNQIKSELSSIVAKAQKAYNTISRKTKIKMHGKMGVDKFKSNLDYDVKNFMDNSRIKAQKAQNRETLTVQPMESLSTLTKAKITIKNYLGGYYYLTTDEIRIDDRNIYLIEGKHSKNNSLPSISDIKDGLLKLILYSNISSLRLNNKRYNKIPVLSLTSDNLKGKILSIDNNKIISLFINKNNFKDKHITIIDILFKEAKHNNFIVEIKNPKC